MKNLFIKGLFTGLIIKDQFINILKFGLNLFYELKKTRSMNDTLDKIDSIDFICKITDKKLFNEVFPDNPNFKYKVQPSWNYYDKKGVIKINLDQELIDFLNKSVNFSYSIRNLFELKNISTNEHFVSLFLPFFESFGINYIYVNYTFLGKKYINIYDQINFINKSDFNEDYTCGFKGILCSNIKYNIDDHEFTEYISSYLKMFYNNKTLTLEHLLLNYDKINVPMDNCKLHIIENSKIKKLNLNETI